MGHPRFVPVWKFSGQIFLRASSDQDSMPGRSEHQLSVEGLGVEAGLEGADGVAGVPEPLLESAGLEASLDSAGLESVEDSEEESELLGA
jgi:hypothetical protein